MLLKDNSPNHVVPLIYLLIPNKYWPRHVDNKKDLSQVLISLSTIAENQSIYTVGIMTQLI